LLAYSIVLVCWFTFIGASLMNQADPIAYFLTWTTYGTWLPGDARGWFAKPGQWHGADDNKKIWSQLRMTDDAVVLRQPERTTVEGTIQRHCQIRGWLLHAVNCRSNHVHVVMTAHEVEPSIVMKQFKAYCTRYLKPYRVGQLQWWSENGSKIKLYTEADLQSRIEYVLEQQDGDRFLHA
jgi:REP element-mobilizing transposase RayT